jgi:hypothetical protein
VIHPQVNPGARKSVNPPHYGNGSGCDEGYKEVNRNVDPQSVATALIEEYGFDTAAAYAVDRIAELHDQQDLYGLSVWREIRKAIGDRSKEADHLGESDDDG